MLKIRDPQVREIVQTELLTCPPQTRLCEAARLMRGRPCSSILVVEEGRPVGIWTEHDATRLDFNRLESFDVAISEVMSAPLKTIPSDLTLNEVAFRFREEGVRHFIVEGPANELLGMVTQSDVTLRHGVEHYLTLRAVDAAMRGAFLRLAGEETVAELAVRMQESKADAAIVDMPDGRKGIITERDLIRLVAERQRCDRLASVASAPLITISRESSLLSARNLLEQRGVRHLGVVDERGEVVGLLSLSDILGILQHEYVHHLTEALKERDQQLIRSRKDLLLAKQVIETSINAIMVTDAEGRIESINPAFTHITGYQPDEVLGRRPGELLKSGRMDADFYRSMWQSLERHGFWEGEIWNRRKNGEVYPEWLTINVIRDEAGAVVQYAAIFNDISERKRAEERIRNLAYFDVLTGLPNRRLFEDRLGMAIASAHRHGHRSAILFLDLDLFKRINDTLGHAAGDEVLMEMSRRLESVRREDDTAARIAGDEFVLLMHEIPDEQAAAKLAERIIDEVQRPFLVGGHELYVTTSIGISLYPDDGSDAEALMQAADLAMYQAKEQGRNSYHLYSPEMNTRSHEKMNMEKALREAVETDGFSLVYQVKVDFSTGLINGVEALLRWIHPEIGSISPARFVPLAERMGLIPKLGEWVMCTACRQAAEWRALGLPPVRMAVNLSSLQFADGQLPELVGSVLARCALDADLLELEFHENTLMQHAETIGESLEALHTMGVHLSLDDFGSGFSSLNLLRRLPIGTLKIDRSIVQGLPDQIEDVDVARLIIEVAHSLGMRAVAEGVENPRQADFLRARRCDGLQGYLVSRPVTAEDMISLFQRRLLPGIQ